MPADQPRPKSPEEGWRWVGSTADPDIDLYRYWNGVLGTGEVNCPFEYESWDQFWRGTRAGGPTQMAIGLAGLDAVERATRKAVEPLTAEDGSITFDANV